MLCYVILQIFYFQFGSVLPSPQNSKIKKQNESYDHRVATEQAAFSRKLSLLNNNDASMGLSRKCFGKFSNCKVRLD